MRFSDTRDSNGSISYYSVVMPLTSSDCTLLACETMVMRQAQVCGMIRNEAKQVPSTPPTCRSFEFVHFYVKSYTIFV